SAPSLSERSMLDWIDRTEEICWSRALVSLGLRGSWFASSVKMILENCSAVRALKPEPVYGVVVGVMPPMLLMRARQSGRGVAPRPVGSAAIEGVGDRGASKSGLAARRLRALGAAGVRLRARSGVSSLMPGAGAIPAGGVGLAAMIRGVVGLVPWRC